MQIKSSGILSPAASHFSPMSFPASLAPAALPPLERLQKLLKDSVALKFSGEVQPAVALDTTPSPLQRPDLSLVDFQNRITDLVAKVKADPDNKTLKVDSIAEMTETLDLFLQGQWTEETQPAKKAALFQGLRELMGPRGQGNIIMAQMNPIAGKLEANAKQIMAYLDAGEQIGADMVVFPEQCLMGYPIYDTIKRHPALVEQNLKWLNDIAAMTGKTRAVVGFVEPRNAPPGEKLEGKEFYNSMAVLGEGKIEGIVRKSLLPTYGEFNDYRTFEFSSVAGTQDPKTLGKTYQISPEEAKDGEPSTIHGKKYGLSICEDIWNFRDWENYPPYYERNPILELAKHNPDVMINISASPSRGRKEQMKHAMLSYIASHPQVGKPLVYVNQNGSIDESSFEGASRVYGADGKLVARAKSFANQFMVVNPTKNEGKIYPLPQGLEGTHGTKNTFDPYDTSDMARAHDSIIQWIRDFYAKTGHKKAVLGLSGGLDSAVVVTLLAEALGPENVMAYSLPSKITSDNSRNDAAQLAKNLGVPFFEISIAKVVKDCWGELIGAVNLDRKTFSSKVKGVFLDVYNKALGGIMAVGGLIAKCFGVDFAQTRLGRKLAAKKQSLTGVFAEMKKHWGEPYKAPTTLQNIQARARALFLWSISNQFPGVMSIATSGKSELYIGYATVNGDMSGGIAPIADLPKTKIRLMARWLNEHGKFKNAMPEAIVTRASGAELEIDPKTGKAVTAEDDNMPYEFMDEIIWRIENKKQSKSEMLADTPEAKFWFEKKYNISHEQKKEWIDKFYRKMSAAVFKWWLLPPGPILDGNGTIMKSDYRQPITAQIKWDGHSDEERKAILNAQITRSASHVDAVTAA